MKKSNSNQAKLSCCTTHKQHEMVVEINLNGWRINQKAQSIVVAIIIVVVVAKLCYPLRRHIALI